MTTLFKKLYVTFVRPNLEYVQVVCAPHLMKYINMIENVQIRATKLVDGLNDLGIFPQTKILDLPTLVYRRVRGDMIEMYKHFRIYDKDTITTSFQPRNRISRSHDYQLNLLMPKDGTRGLQTNSIYFRTAKMWNNLPKYVVDAKDNTFKKYVGQALGRFVNEI